jgi:carboxyl-terminal processing protease
MLARGGSVEPESPPSVARVAAIVEPSLLDEVSERVRRDYVDPVSSAALEQAAASGILASLDPHSALLDARQYEAIRVSTSGHYSGVGLEVTERDGRVVVVSSFEGSPARQAGLRAGDSLLAIDGHGIAAGQLDEAIHRMRGLVGSKVRLAVAREGEAAPLVFDLERSDVRVLTVRAESLPGPYAYVRIAQFSDATPTDLDAALAALQRGRPLEGLVLDLRGNPGGVLESAVDVADEFLETGLIVRASGRTPHTTFEMHATDGDALRAAALVVLVDRSSASGAEIVAGALRDHRRATLMGERTYGKGSVQTVLPLSDGRALKLTTSRYYTPSGASIHEHGIEPDVPLSLAASDPADPPLAPAADPAVRAALQYLRDRSLAGRQVALAGRR